MNPAKHTISAILPAFAGNVFDYASSEDFHKLWNFEYLPPERIVVVWSRTALDLSTWPINAAGALSPLDWAAAYLSSLGGNPICWPEILILDFAPQAHVQVPSIVHYSSLRPTELPWLRLLPNPDLYDVCRWLDGRAASPGGTFEALEAARLRGSLQRFLRQIRLGLGDRTVEGEIDHHSVFNLVAPLVLNQGRRKDDDKRANHPLALAKLLRSTYPLRTDAELGALRSGLPGIESAQRHGLEEGVRFVLLDDQANHGWSEWLEWTVAKLLPGSTCETWTDPILLVQRLETALQICSRESNDSRFKLRLGTTDLPEILVLDLRMFAGQSEGREERFYRKLLELCRRFVGQNDISRSTVFAWPAFSAEELDRVEEWYQLDAHIRTEREKGAFPQAAGLLARLVSLIDPTLPVIIFSSTGRADLIRQFENYENIITAFSKPHDFQLTPEEIIRSTHELFRSAVQQTLPMLKFKSWVKEIERRPRRIAKHKPALTITDKSVVEIYLDESGVSLTPPFTVGGLLLIYPGIDSIKVLSKVLDAQDLVWGLDESFNGQYRVRGTYLRKYPQNSERWDSDPYGDPIRKLNEIFETLRIQIAGIALQLKGKPDLMLPRGLKGFNENLTDLRCFKMLTDLLECAIFGLLRSRTRTTEIGINVPTRTGTIRASDEDDARARYGLKFAYRNAAGLAFYSVTPESVLPAVTGALGQHLRSDLQFNLLRLKTCALADYDTLEKDRIDNPELYSSRIGRKVGEFPRQIHYLADWMARFANQIDYDKNVPEIARGWFQKGILQRQGQGSAFTVLALRAADNLSWREAVLMARKAEVFEYTKQPNQSRAPAIDFVLPRIQEWCAHLDGQSLWTLASEIKDSFESAG